MCISRQFLPFSPWLCFLLLRNWFIRIIYAQLDNSPFCTSFVHVCVLDAEKNWKSNWFTQSLGFSIQSTFTYIRIRSWRANFLCVLVVGRVPLSIMCSWMERKSSNTFVASLWISGIRTTTEWFPLWFSPQPRPTPICASIVALSTCIAILVFNIWFLYFPIFVFFFFFISSFFFGVDGEIRFYHFVSVVKFAFVFVVASTAATATALDVASSFAFTIVSLSL